MDAHEAPADASRGAAPARRDTLRRLVPGGPRARLALGAILLAGLAAGVMIENWSANQSSHYDLIRALDDGRTRIDSGPYPTIDRALFKGHYYSARAPGLALYSLPFYELLEGVGAPGLARSSPALHGEDEMVDFVGWWGNVLPGLILMGLVWRVAERLEPGYGAFTAVAVGLGTLLLPFSTMLFSHVFSAMLGFAAFAVAMRERAGPPRPLLLAAVGLLVGYAISSEYPLAFVAIVVGLYVLSRPGSRGGRAIAARLGSYALGALAGIVPLALYNRAAFGSFTHIAYSNIPQQQKGFFGITAPNPKVLATLLLDSRGLLTISPVLILGGVGTWLLFRGGRRSEALAITGVCLCYGLYNSGYYLPFGGTSPGPRFLITVLPFLGCPIGLALKRHPGPTIALAGASVMTLAIVTATHPLVIYETNTLVWAKLLGQGEFQATIATAFGLGRGWSGIWPFVLAVGGAVLLAGAATPRLRLDRRQLAAGAGSLLGWGLFAALAPTLLGIDHRALESIFKAGDPKAFAVRLHGGSRFPLTSLVLYSGAAGAVAMAGMWALRREPPEGPASAPARARPATAGAAPQPG